MKKCIVVYLSLLLETGLVFASPPEDIATIQKLHDLIKGNLGSHGSTIDVTPFLQVANEMASETLARAGIAPYLSASSREELSGAMGKFIHQKLQKIRDSPDPGAKRETAMKLLLSLTSPRWFESYIARWIGFPSVGKLRKSALVPLGPPEKAFQEPVGSMEHASLQWQGTSIRSRGGFRISESLSAVEVDYGGTGSENHRINPGEWLRLSLVLENTNTRRMFSTSAWIQSRSSCVWVDPDVEYELAELDAEKGMSTIHPWLFVSSQCGGKSDLSFSISLRDTHQPDAGEITVSFTAPQSTASLTGVLFDTDLPGYSDGRNLTGMQVSPGMTFELSSNVIFNGVDPVAVFTYYAFEPQAKPVIKEQSYTLLPLERREGGLFVATDDLDVTMASGELFTRGERSLIRSNMRARQSKDGPPVLWVAVEVSAWVQEKLTSLVSRREVRQVVTVSDAPNEPPKDDRVPISALPGLLRKYISLRPLPSSPSSGGGITATHGYEVVLDEEALRKALSATANRPASPPPVVKRSVEVKPKVLAQDLALYQYLFRFYLPVTLPAVAAPVQPPSIEPVPVQEPVVRVKQNTDAETAEAYRWRTRQMTQPKRSGCGCTMAGEDDYGSILILCAGALVALLRRRKSRRRTGNP